MSVEKFTPEGLLYAGAIIVGLIIVYNTLMTAIKNYFEAKKRRDAPVDELKTIVDNHTQMLDNDNKRIKELNERLDDMGDEMVLMLRSNRALLSHEINGNSIDRLQDSMSEIDDYLIKRK